MAEAERQRNWIPRDVQGAVTCDPHMQQGIQSAAECKFCNRLYVAPQQPCVDIDRGNSLEEQQNQLSTNEEHLTSISSEETMHEVTLKNNA